MLAGIPFKPVLEEFICFDYSFMSACISFSTDIFIQHYHWPLFFLLYFNCQYPEK